MKKKTVLTSAGFIIFFSAQLSAGNECGIECLVQLFICFSYLFTYGESRCSPELVQKCPCIPGSNWNLEMLVFEERGKPEYPEKNPRSRVENQQQTQPTYDAGSGNRTRDTVVGGERSHHCAISVENRLAAI